MAKGPEKSGRKKALMVGAALAAVTAAVPFLAHRGEDADAKKPAVQHEKADDAGVKDLQTVFGKAAAFAATSSNNVRHEFDHKGSLTTQEAFEYWKKSTEKEIAKLLQRYGTVVEEPVWER